MKRKVSMDGWGQHDAGTAKDNTVGAHTRSLLEKCHVLRLGT